MRKHAEIRKDAETRLGKCLWIHLHHPVLLNIYPYRGLLNPDHPWSVFVRKTKMGMDRYMRSKEKSKYYADWCDHD